MQAVIFDMDGTLIDSEPIWKEAEKQVFSSVGVQVSENLSAYTASMTTREVTEFWFKRFPWSGKSLHQVENEVIDRVATLITEKGKPMDGVEEILHFFQKRNFKIGLSTNAPTRLIPVVLEKLNISKFFLGASSSENEIQGKPHPAVYLSTIKKLNADPKKCIAFEDSLSGVISASRAKLKTVIVHPQTDFTDKKYEIAQMKLRRLTDFTELHLEKILND